MPKKIVVTLPATMLEQQTLTLLDVSRAVGSPAEVIVELIEYGVVEPTKGRSAKNWEFSPLMLRRARKAVRLQRDLNVNLAGLALALDLLEEVEQLRNRVSFFEHHLSWGH